MEIVSQPDYIITYDLSYPITNEKINEIFGYFHHKVRNQINLENYPENLFQLANCIIRLYNDKVNSRDATNYINHSISLWSNLKKFQILNDFYFDTLTDAIQERNLNYIYEINSIIYDFDTIKILKAKKKALIECFRDINILYTQILIRINSHKNNHIFSFQAYKNRITENMNSNRIQEPYALKTIEDAIEKIKNKNHCRAVLKQCFDQNFGFKNLKPLENHLIYKIDKFLY